MSGCFGCYFYEGGFMWNRCNYFEMEYFGIKDKCVAFTTDGNISEESEAKIFNETNGMFGKPKKSREGRRMIPKKIDKCDTCERYDHEKDCMRNELQCMFTCEDLIQYQTRQAAMYEAWCEQNGIAPEELLRND